MNLGPAEILVILFIGLLVFGPSRLPELSRQLGGAMKQLRQMQSSLKREINEAMRDEPAKPMPRRGAPGATTDSEPDHTDMPPPSVDTTTTGTADLPPAPNTSNSGTDPFAGPDESFI